MKRLISLIMAAAVILAVFTACDSEKAAVSSPMHTLYFRDGTKSGKALVTFFNSKSGKKKTVKMEEIEKDKNAVTFSCEGDTSVYNMAYITCGKDKTEEFAFNKCVSGWYKTEVNFLPYTYGQKIDYHPEYDNVKLKYKGYEKEIYIWTPADYDGSSDEKYSTVYVLDGQIMTYNSAIMEKIGMKDRSVDGCPIVTEQVKAMSAANGTKAIVVAVDNTLARDFELVPDLGTSFDEKMGGAEITKEDYDALNGNELSDFFAEKLVPYVQEHYNVYTDALHTSVAGVSLGGLECFYIAMENPDLFGTVGSLSPSFWEYDKATWNKYLGKKTFGEQYPFVYIYTGSPTRGDVGPFPKQMIKRLKKMGYPENKLAYHYNENGTHSARIWRAMFSEFLSAMVYQRVEPLGSGL